jgi:hypothetical protein
MASKSKQPNGSEPLYTVTDLNAMGKRSCLALERAYLVSFVFSGCCAGDCVRVCGGGFFFLVVFVVVARAFLFFFPVTGSCQLTGYLCNR